MLLFFLLGAVYSIRSEVLIFPPALSYTNFATSGKSNLEYSPSWINYDVHVRGVNRQDHSYDLEVGALFPFWMNNYGGVGGGAQMQFQNQVNPLGSLFFYPSAIFTKLMLFSWFDTSIGKMAAGAYHDCKHGIDFNRGRISIHDVVFTEWGNAFELSFPESGRPVLLLDPKIRLRYFFPALYNYRPENPVVWDINISFYSELTISEGGELFADGMIRGIYRKKNTKISDTKIVSVPRTMDMDWIIRAGVHLPKADKGASVYWFAERLSDNRLHLDVKLVYLTGFSILLKHY